jgi:hypothetical protein
MKKGLILVLAPIIFFTASSEGQLLKKIKNKIDKGLSNDAQPASNPSSSRPFASKDYGRAKYKLRDGEKLLSGEACVEYSGGEKFMFITQLNGKFYFHNGDQISGPFDKPPVDSLPCWTKKENQNRPSMATRNPKDKVDVSKYTVIDRNGTVPFSLKIGGKTYGPYNMITQVAVSGDESRFYAFVMLLGSNGEVDNYLVSHKGKMKLPGILSDWLISPDFGICALPAFEAQLKGPVDPGKIDPNSPVYLLYDDGHKVGPIPEFYGTGDKIFTNSGKLLQLRYNERKTIFIDGKPGLTFPVDIPSFEGVLLNDALTAGAYFESGNLYFSDGGVIENEAIKPQIFKGDGKIYIRWMAIDDAGNIYDCKKEL